MHGCMALILIPRCKVLSVLENMISSQLEMQACNMYRQTQKKHLCSMIQKSSHQQQGNPLLLKPAKDFLSPSPKMLSVLIMSCVCFVCMTCMLCTHVFVCMSCLLLPCFLFLQANQGHLLARQLQLVCNECKQKLAHVSQTRLKLWARQETHTSCFLFPIKHNNKTKLLF